MYILVMVILKLKVVWSNNLILTRIKGAGHSSDHKSLKMVVNKKQKSKPCAEKLNIDTGREDA